MCFFYLDYYSSFASGLSVFFQGAIESVSAGEIKLSLRQSLVKLGVGFLSRDPKVQVLICDLEVVMRSSTSAKNVPKAKSQKPRNSGRGKWMVVANIARFLSVSVADMVVKVTGLSLPSFFILNTIRRFNCF